MAGRKKQAEEAPIDLVSRIQRVEGRLSPAERQVAVALEYGMEKRRLKVRVRQAMVQYLETALGLVPADGKPLPPRLERVR